MAKAKLYVIGKRGEGIVFLRTSPLRVVQISHETIVEYEASNPGTDGYARVAASAKGIFSNSVEPASSSVNEALETLIRGGAVVSEADFTFIGDVEDSGWDDRRHVQLPLAQVLEALAADAIASGELFDAILSDSPNSAV